MPLRDDFFTNLMIRATPAMALNDPFEGYFNKKQVRDADRNQTEYYKKNGKEVDETDESGIDGLMGATQFDLFSLGILSFTEDHNNPLMWAHYANDHKGVVVEFDFNEPFFMDSLQKINGRKSRFGKSYLGDVFEFPEKVDYRRELPSFERPELSAPDSMEEFHWKKFNRAILFTKANDWLYEKEQRSIVRLTDADSIVCKDCEHIRKECSKDKRIELTDLKDGRIQITYPCEYEAHDNIGDPSIKSEIYMLALNYSDPPIHLFRINPLAISGVYFGCKAKYEGALDKIESHPSLKHLKNIFKMQINNSQYQFNASKLTKKSNRPQKTRRLI